MAQSLSELIGQGAEKLGGWGLETGAKAKKKLSEIADIAMANDTSTAGDKVTAIGQSLAQGGGALLGDVGKAVDTVNPINYAPKLFGAKTLSEQGYGVEGFAKKVGENLPSAIERIGKGGQNLADAIDKTQRVFGGEISIPDYGVGLTKDLSSLGANAIGALFSMAAPILSPAIATAFEVTGLDEYSQSGKEFSANKIMETLGVPEKYKPDVKESLFSAFDIVSAYAGIKGSKTMNKLEGTKLESKIAPTTGKLMTEADGKTPMLFETPGKRTAGNVAKGMLQASLPDMTLAITGAIGSDDSVGSKVGKAIATSLLTVAANHPSIGPDMFKIKGKKEKLTDSELQAKNDEAIKADGEAVSKSEKSLSQIALDQADKRNSESKTIGKWTPELEAEYVKSGFTGSRGDYMKGGGKVNIEATPEFGSYTPIEFFTKNGIRQTEFESSGKAIKGKGKGYTQEEFLNRYGLSKSDFKLIEGTKGEDGLYVLKDKNTVEPPKPTLEQVATKPVAETIAPKVEPIVTPKPTLSEVATKTPPKKQGIYDSFIKTFALPKELTKGTPAYKTFTVDFSNDFNKALYIIRESRGARSKSDAKYLDVVMKQTGLDEASARKLGDTVLENIKFKEGNGDIQDNVITVDANLFGGKTPTVAKAEPAKDEVKPTLAEIAMEKPEQPEEVIGEPVVEEVKTQPQPEMRLPPDLQAKIDEANDLWEEMRQDSIRNNLHPDEVAAKQERYEKLKQEAEDIANGYRQRRTMAQDGTQLGGDGGTIPPEGDLPFETKTPKPDLTNNLVNDAVINEESRNKTSGRFEVTTLPGKVGAYLSEKGGRLLSLGAYLKNIKVVLDNGKRVSFNTFIDSVRSSAINIANGIIDRYGIRKIVNDLPDPGDVKVGNDALVGAVTPMGTVITDKNSSIVKDILKDITRLRFDHLGFNNKKLAKINALGYIWRINQGLDANGTNPRQAIIDKYVPKEYQDFFQAINDNDGLARKVYDDAGNVLQDRKALAEKDDSEMYTRFILSETGKKWMRKHGVKYELIIGKGNDAKTIEYDSVEDLRKAMGMYAAQGIPFTDKTVKNFESILKEKGGAEIDIFRIHSPLAQLLDYSGHFGKLVSDIEVVKKFGELQKEKDPVVQDYTAKMTTSENFANPIEQVLNINRAAKGLGERASQSLGNLARTQLLFFSVKNLVQGMTSAQLRRAMYASGLVKGQAGKFTDYKNSDNEMVQSRLHGEGFLTNYELLPGEHSRLKDQVIWWSSAGENSAKTHIALSGMEQALKDNKVAYDKNDALSITEKFQEWASFKPNKDKTIDDMRKEFKAKNIPLDPKTEAIVYEAWKNEAPNRDRAIEIKSDIKQNNNTVSDVSSMARSQVPFMQRFGFGSMKTYGIGQVTQNLQDLGTIVDRAVLGKGKISNEQTQKAVSRVAVQFGGYVMVATIASAIWKSTQPEPKDDEEKKELDRQAEAIGNAIGGQAYGNPIATFKNLFTGILSNTGLAPVQAAADILQVLTLFASDGKEGYKAGLNELVRSTLQGSALGKTIDASVGILSEKSLQRMFSEAIGSVTRENQSRAGVSTGKKIGTRSEFARNLLGYNTDNAIEQMIYNEFEKSKIAQKYDLDRDSISAGTIGLLTKIYTDNVRAIERAGEIAKGIAGYNDNIIGQQYVANVVNASRDVKSFQDLTASVIGAAKGLDKSREDVKKANDAYEKILGETWITFGIDNNLPLYDKLEMLRTKNPVAYNNTVAGLAKSLKYMNNIKNGTAKFSQEEDMKAMYASDPNVDAAISELNGTAPNSVAVIDQINSGLSNFQRDIGTIGIEGAKKKFAEVEAMNKILNGVSLYADTYEKALANGTFQYDGVIKAMEDNGYGDFKKDFPITTELIHRGLMLRGETELKPIAGKFPTDNGTILTGGSNQLSSEPIKTNLNYVGTPKKPKLSELALLKPVQVAPKPLFNPLAQPTEGSLLQMAMRRK